MHEMLTIVHDVCSVYLSVMQLKSAAAHAVYTMCHMSRVIQCSLCQITLTTCSFCNNCNYYYICLQETKKINARSGGGEVND